MTEERSLDALNERLGAMRASSSRQASQQEADDYVPESIPEASRSFTDADDDSLSRVRPRSSPFGLSKC